MLKCNNSSSTRDPQTSLWCWRMQTRRVVFLAFPHSHCYASSYSLNFNESLHELFFFGNHIYGFFMVNACRAWCDLRGDEKTLLTGINFQSTFPILMARIGFKWKFSSENPSRSAQKIVFMHACKAEIFAFLPPSKNFTDKYERLKLFSPRCIL